MHEQGMSACVAPCLYLCMSASMCVIHVVLVRNICGLIEG